MHATTARRDPGTRSDQRAGRAVLHATSSRCSARTSSRSRCPARATWPGISARTRNSTRPDSALPSWPRTRTRSRSSSTSRTPPTGPPSPTWSASPTCWWRTSGPACSAGWASTGRRLHELNPGLVYCAISGFGQTGPMSQAPAYDQVIQGLSGMMSITGTQETAPLRVGFPVCDTLGGLTAALAVAAALAGRATRRARLLPGRVHAGGVGLGHGLGRLQLPRRRGRAAAHGRPERHRRPVGHVPRRRRAAEHRRQPAGAVREPVPLRRPARPARPTRASPTGSGASDHRDELNGELNAALREPTGARVGARAQPRSACRPPGS